MVWHSLDTMRVTSEALAACGTVCCVMLTLVTCICAVRMRYVRHVYGRVSEVGRARLQSAWLLVSWIFALALAAWLASTILSLGWLRSMPR